MLLVLSRSRCVRCCRHFNAKGDQFPRGYFHLGTESFKPLFTKVAPPNFDRYAICPGQAGFTRLSCGAEEPDDPRASVCTPLRFLQKHIFLIYPELQRHWG